MKNTKALDADIRAGKLTYPQLCKKHNTNSYVILKRRKVLGLIDGTRSAAARNRGQGKAAKASKATHAPKSAAAKSTPATTTWTQPKLAEVLPIVAELMRQENVQRLVLNESGTYERHGMTVHKLAAQPLPEHREFLGMAPQAQAS